VAVPRGFTSKSFVASDAFPFFIFGTFRVGPFQVGGGGVVV
jgi:hypothetical protein